MRQLTYSGVPNFEDTQSHVTLPSRTGGPVFPARTVSHSLAKGLRREAAGFSPALAPGASVTPFGRSHRPEAVSLRENDIVLLMLGTPHPLKTGFQRGI